jgi:hypothetical protein
LQHAFFADGIRKLLKLFDRKGLARLKGIGLEPAHRQRSLCSATALGRWRDRRFFADQRRKATAETPVPALFRALGFAGTHAAATRSRWISSPASLM